MRVGCPSKAELRPVPGQGQVGTRSYVQAIWEEAAPFPGFNGVGGDHPEAVLQLGGQALDPNLLQRYWYVSVADEKEISLKCT